MESLADANVVHRKSSEMRRPPPIIIAAIIADTDDYDDDEEELCSHRRNRNVDYNDDDHVSKSSALGTLGYEIVIPSTSGTITNGSSTNNSSNKGTTITTTTADDGCSGAAVDSNTAAMVIPYNDDELVCNVNARNDKSDFGTRSTRMAGRKISTTIPTLATAPSTIMTTISTTRRMTPTTATASASSSAASKPIARHTNNAQVVATTRSKVVAVLPPPNHVYALREVVFFDDAKHHDANSIIIDHHHDYANSRMVTSRIVQTSEEIYRQLESSTKGTVLCPLSPLIPSLSLSLSLEEEDDEEEESIVIGEDCNFVGNGTPRYFRAEDLLSNPLQPLNPLKLAPPEPAFHGRRRQPAIHDAFVDEGNDNNALLQSLQSLQSSQSQGRQQRRSSSSLFIEAVGASTILTQMSSTGGARGGSSRRLSSCHDHHRTVRGNNATRRRTNCPVMLPPCYDNDEEIENNRHRFHGGTNNDNNHGGVAVMGTKKDVDNNNNESPPSSSSSSLHNAFEKNKEVKNNKKKKKWTSRMITRRGSKFYGSVKRHMPLFSGVNTRKTREKMANNDNNFAGSNTMGSCSKSCSSSRGNVIIDNGDAKHNSNSATRAKTTTTTTKTNATTARCQPKMIVDGNGIIDWNSSDLDGDCRRIVSTTTSNPFVAYSTVNTSVSSLPLVPSSVASVASVTSVASSSSPPSPPPPSSSKKKKKKNGNGTKDNKTNSKTTSMAIPLVNASSSSLGAMIFGEAAVIHNGIEPSEFLFRVCVCVCTIFIYITGDECTICIDMIPLASCLCLCVYMQPRFHIFSHVPSFYTNNTHPCTYLYIYIRHLSSFLLQIHTKVNEIACVNRSLGIYVSESGLSAADCVDIIRVSEYCASSRGGWSSYTYAKQTLGCRECDPLAFVSARPVLTACATIRRHLTIEDDDDDDDDDDDGRGGRVAGVKGSDIVVGSNNDDGARAIANNNNNNNSSSSSSEGRVTDLCNRGENGVDNMGTASKGQQQQHPPPPQKELVLDVREPHVVKYDTSKTERQKLDMHTDKSEWTFLIALSEGRGQDYKGGGTYFQSLNSTVHLQRGQMLICEYI